MKPHENTPVMPSASSSSVDHLRVECGYLLMYRFFDVADSINLDVAFSLIAQTDKKRQNLRRFPKTQLTISAPPLLFDLGMVSIDDEKISTHNGQPIHAQICVRVFDFGVLGLMLKIPFPKQAALARLVLFNHACSESAHIEQLFQRTATELSTQLLPALLKPTSLEFFEDYAISYVEAFNESPPLDTLAKSPILAKLILNEAAMRRVAEEALCDATSFSFSYYDDELTVLDWNSAFIYDPSKDSDICDLLEFANAQLLELRSYDALLDRELKRIYQEISSASGWARKRRYRQLSRRLLQVVLEVTELTEKIDNSVQWVRDIYLSRVYQAATTQFNIPHWQAQVERKITLVSKISELLTDQLNTDRSMLLETSIACLIVIELALAIFR